MGRHFRKYRLPFKQHREQNNVVIVNTFYWLFLRLKKWAAVPGLMMRMSMNGAIMVSLLMMFMM